MTPRAAAAPTVGRSSSVLAVITHYHYERWLAQAIESIRQQSHRADAIVVLDDASAQPPVDVVGQFPDVTLMVADENRGPYAMLQAVFDRADYVAFLLQDADDWSTADRLEVLLAAADRTGAEMIGCQATSEYIELPTEPELDLPSDARSAVLAKPTVHPVLMPTSVIGRDLVHRVGGLATGLRFSADSEFIRRAVFAGGVINVQDRCYHRRVHPLSLTQAHDTGYRSPARTAVRAQLQERARANVARVSAGEEPDLSPLVTGPTARLTHVMGPRLRWNDGA